jgi:hypothetical protein
VGGTYIAPIEHVALQSTGGFALVKHSAGRYRQNGQLR